MNISNYDLYYTVIKNRDEKEIVNDENQNYENGFIKLNDVIIPNHYVGIKGGEKWDLVYIISSNFYYINRDDN